MTELPNCMCDEMYLGERNHAPECPAQRAFTDLQSKLATLMNSSKLIYELEDVKRERDDLKSRLGEHSTQLEQALRDVRQAQRSMETSNGYVTVGRRLHDVEKILARIVERQCPFSSDAAFENDRPQQCVRSDGHDGPHELGSGHYIHR